ncbi:hypothetical protein EHV15_27630 [Paenibacillus oralis]|uniref:Uncharacterized protein n=1 Tax=Paenibacillus oralis TaxID=2490856 RepID=A0A3P3U7B6_9BACL|nr:hypothetical protein [Paenibacillus oralis]RRJ66267.1 hypothetical protein EHV15_27630 [Paenibacillus oralis]
MNLTSDSPLLERQIVGWAFKNSGTLCTYDPEPGLFIPVSGIFSLYFPMNGPKRGHFLANGKNSDINYLYILLKWGDRRNNALFCPYVY